MTPNNRSESIRARLDAPAHVKRMMLVLSQRGEDVIARLASQTSATIADWPDLTITILEEQRSSDRSCSVAGVYIGEQVPAVLGIAQASPARMRFTALHELGHHIQQNDDELAEALAGRGDLGHALEEEACDLFAAQILLPPEAVDAALGRGTPSATDLVRLWGAHHASRAAVCVAGVRKLETDGHIVLLDDAGTVAFAASKGLPRLARGSDQSRTEALQTLLQMRGQLAQGKTRFRYRDDIRGEELWFQAAPAGEGFWILVAAPERVPWERLSLPSLNCGPIGKWWTCALCDHNWQSFVPKCERCGAPECPECLRCECRLTTNLRTCSECFIQRPLHEFPNGGTVCFDH